MMFAGAVENPFTIENMRHNTGTSLRAPRSSTASVRQLRVGETMRRILAETLSRGDFPHPFPHCSHITVTEVRVSPDLRNASVFLLPLHSLHGKAGDGELQAVLDALERNRGFLRARLGALMRIKNSPSMTFAIDRSFDAAREVDRLLRQPRVARDLQIPPAEAFAPPCGWLILDKPKGITSAQAVAQVKHRIAAGKGGASVKIGHCGTLDPAAEGVLPIALGEATKLISLLANAPKSYRFSLAWGVATSTDDAEGEVIATSPVRPRRPEIRAALQEFLGDIEQLPPRYSSVRVGGRRAYALARAGENFELRPRLVRLHSATLLPAEGEDNDDRNADVASFEISCSKGFYVRSLARDLGARLASCAHVTRLRRLSVGGFGEDMAIPLELELESETDLPHTDDRQRRAEVKRLLAALLSVERILEAGDIPTVAVTDSEAARLRQGKSVFLSFLGEKMALSYDASAAPAVAMCEGRVVALVRCGEGGKTRPVRVLHPQGTAAGV